MSLINCYCFNNFLHGITKMTDMFSDPSLTLNGLLKPDTVWKLGQKLLPNFTQMASPLEMPPLLPVIRPKSPCLPLDLHMSPKRTPPDEPKTPYDVSQGTQMMTQDLSINREIQHSSTEDQEKVDHFSLTPLQLKERAQEFLLQSKGGAKRKLTVPVRMPDDIGMECISDREVLLDYYKEMLLQRETSPCKQMRTPPATSESSTAGGLVAEETRKPETYSPTSSPLDNSAPVSPTSKATGSPSSKTDDSPEPSSPQPATQGGPEQGSYPCSHCEKSFAYMGNLKRHIKMHHGEYRPYKCHLCIKRFWGNDSLEQHVKRVHSRFRPYECAHCDKKYSVCYDLQKHVRSVHGKDIDWNMDVPSMPSDGSGTTPGLGTHKVTGIKTQALNQLNHKCKFCGRGFATFNGLGVHLKMHFRCRVCFKGFNTESSLRIHLQKAHDITGDQEYVL
ncbi:zinc finger protein 62 homolog isoform X1 [Saccostrea echinata]|uniref:zinc finger protein 62 homolog isoform X1 n=2 Tax=Saccostrea echinata TaxID=191078 RepID=UPI002A816FDB|nr:zinc finger protein 62 homolog isoform X1 [Saccostrea echinata]